VCDRINEIGCNKREEDKTTRPQKAGFNKRSFLRRLPYKI